MLLHIPTVLPPEQLPHIRSTLQACQWQDGRSTAGPQARLVKRNWQAGVGAANSCEEAEAQIALAAIGKALQNHPLFVSAALPAHVLPPMFNCYQVGDAYGKHVDAAVQRDAHSGNLVRSDVSVTVFLNEPDEYDGGELLIEDRYGEHEVKLAAGDAIVYPSSSLHQVKPVTRGMRLAAITWVQSMVADAWQRDMLFDLDQNIQQLRAQLGDSQQLLALSGHYHNLLRLWAKP